MISTSIKNLSLLDYEQMYISQMSVAVYSITTSQLIATSPLLWLLLTQL